MGKEDLVIEAKNFFDFNKKELGASLRKNSKVIYVDFMKLKEFSSTLSEEILVNPEETLKLMEIAIIESGLVNEIQIHLENFPKSERISLDNLRLSHLDRIIEIEGRIIQRGKIIPRVVNSKFECPSCGTVISVLQMEKKFREPGRCSCGRRGGFKLLSKEMIETVTLYIKRILGEMKG